MSIELQRQINDLNERLNKLVRVETPLFWEGTNVGIGAASTGAKLYIKGTNVAGADTIVGLMLDRLYGSVGDIMALDFGDTGASGIGRIATVAWASGEGAITFSAQTAAGNGLTNEIMRIRGDGNVGIGTTTPVAKLDVTNGYIRALDNGTNNAPSGGSGLELVSTGSVGHVQAYNRNAGAFIQLDINGSPIRLGTNGANVGIGGTPTRQFSILAGVNAYQSFGSGSNERWVIGVESVNSASSYMIWYDSTNGQHRMRLGPDANLHVQNAMYIGSVTTTPSYQVHLSADSAGKPTSSVWTIVSDSRSKDKVTKRENALSRIKQLQVKDFEFNGDFGTERGKKGVGVVAEEMQLVYPNSVNTVQFYNENGTTEDVLTVNYHEAFVDALVAIQELTAEIELLKTKNK